MLIAEVRLSGPARALQSLEATLPKRVSVPWGHIGDIRYGVFVGEIPYTPYMHCCFIDRHQTLTYEVQTSCLGYRFFQLLLQMSISRAKQVWQVAGDISNYTGRGILSRNDQSHARLSFNARSWIAANAHRLVLNNYTGHIHTHRFDNYNIYGPFDGKADAVISGNDDAEYRTRSC